jgi:hypothetical protein
MVKIPNNTCRLICALKAWIMEDVWPRLASYEILVVLTRGRAGPQGRDGTEQSF